MVMRDVNLKHIDFRWVWAKVLPQVYDDSLSYYEQLCKLGAALDELSTECEEHFEEIYGLIDIVNGEIERVETETNNRIDGVAGDVTTAQGDILTLMTRTADLSGGLMGQVLCKTSGSNYDFEWKSIEDVIRPHKFLLIGDSFGEGSGWIEMFAYRMGITSYYHYAEGGIGYCHPGNNSNKAIKDALIDYVATLTTADIESVTDIIVILGENDIKPQHLDNISTAVGEFQTYLKNTFINVSKILVGFNATYLTPAHPTFGDRGQYKYQVRRAIAANSLMFPHVAFDNGIEFSINCTAYISEDGVHPNVVGYQYLTRAIMNAYNGAEWDCPIRNTQHNLNWCSATKVCEVEVAQNAILYNDSAITLSQNGFTTIGTWSDLPFYPKYGTSMYIPLSRIYVNDSTYINNVILRIAANGTVQIYNPDTSISVTKIMNVISTFYYYDASQ